MDTIYKDRGMKKLSQLLLSTCVTLSFMVSCQQESAKPAATSSVVLNEVPSEFTVLTDPDLTTFASLVKKANLITFFHGTGPFTSFIPSNEAFLKFDRKKLAELEDPKNMDELVDFINYHVILGKYLSQNLKSGIKRTVNGKNINVRSENGQIWVNDAKVTKTDLVGPNGVTYIVDTVLMP